MFSEEYLRQPSSDFVERTARPSTLFDHERIANEATRRYAGLGLPLEFSLASLSLVDAFITGLASPNGIAPRDYLWTPTSDEENHILALGSYVGEVLRRRVGGVWRDSREDESFEGRPELVLPSGKTHKPLVTLWERFRSGVEFSSATSLRELFELEGGQETTLDGASWARAARVLAGLGDLLGARAHLIRAVELDASQGEAWRARGELEERLGLPESALASYRAALGGARLPHGAIQDVQGRIRRLAQHSDLGPPESIDIDLLAEIELDSMVCVDFDDAPPAHPGKQTTRRRVG